MQISFIHKPSLFLSFINNLRYDEAFYYEKEISFSFYLFRCMLYFLYVGVCNEEG